VRAMKPNDAFYLLGMILTDITADTAGLNFAFCSSPLHHSL